MPEHTPEPWHTLCRGEGRSALVASPDGLTLATCLGPPGPANARRLAAAVNACRGLPTEALESLARSGILAQLWDDHWEHWFNNH